MVLEVWALMVSTTSCIVIPLVIEIAVLLPPASPSENVPARPSAVDELDCEEPITFCAVASWVIWSV